MMDADSRRDLSLFVAKGRLEFIYSEPAKLMDSRMMVENVIEQHLTDTQYLKYNFGDRYHPRVAWTQRDTSGSHASLDMLAALGYDTIIFAKKDIDESFYNYIQDRHNSTYFKHHRTGMTVILAPERPTVFTFDCMKEDGSYKTEAQLRKMARNFYNEHILPAIEAKIGHGGHVPVFVSGVHNAAEASCLYRLSAIVDEMGASSRTDVPKIETKFRTASEFAGYLHAQPDKMYHFYGDIPLSEQDNVSADSFSTCLCPKHLA